MLAVYRNALAAQPGRHAGLMLTVAVLVHIAGRFEEPDAGRFLPVDVLLLGVGAFLWKSADSWATIRQESRVLGWWRRRLPPKPAKPAIAAPQREEPRVPVEV
jgi:hypothetical protein